MSAAASNEVDPYKDLVDLVIAGSKELRWEEQPDGRNKLVESNNFESLYYITRSVASPVFAEFVYQLKVFESKIIESRNNMSVERSDIVEQLIRSRVDAFKRSIDSKSSESLRNGKINTANLIDKLLSRKTEKTVTLTGQGKQGFANVFMGKEAENT